MLAYADVCWRMLTYADNKLKIALAGGIEALIAAMAEHKASAGVQEQACWAMRSLAGAH